MKQTHKTHKSLLCRLTLVMLSLVLLGGCATKQPRSKTPVVGPTPAPTETKLPPETTETPAERESIEVPPQKIALVLGGAGVSSFATVGLLKRFQQEGIPIQFIIASGWPALFALANGFLKSVHDVEWFSMRLKREDFFEKDGLFGGGDPEFGSLENVEKLVVKSFRQSDLRQSRIPVYIAATNLHNGNTSMFSSGDWKTPLMRSLSVPGLNRPYLDSSQGNPWISSLEGLHTSHELLRDVDQFIAVDMYQDYFQFLRKKRVDSSGTLFRRIHQVQFQIKTAQNFAKAPLRSKIVLRQSPDNFSAKRQAIKAGYDEGARLIRYLRSTRKP